MRTCGVKLIIQYFCLVDSNRKFDIYMLSFIHAQLVMIYLNIQYKYRGLGGQICRVCCEMGCQVAGQGRPLQEVSRTGKLMLLIGNQGCGSGWG